MLALTRRIGERIIIDKNVTITLLSTRRGSARIGIEAPKSVAVRREEVTDMTLDASHEDGN